VPTGTGFVQIAHGRCSVPAPAVGELLRGVPLAPSEVPFELTTPTGAAILAALVESYGPLPAMRIERIGYGAGQRDLEAQANLLRLLVGEAEGAQAGEQIWVLETNLDDTSGELVGYACARLLEAGALDAFTTPIQMKKSRPAVMLNVLCRESDVERMEAILFRETSTLGVRRHAVRRSTLKRESHQVQTPWGPVAGVVAHFAGQAPKFSPEYESCQHLARQHGVPLRDVYEAAQKAYSP
jgi:uncharacterized protein (TIGR00299 family) protein